VCEKLIKNSQPFGKKFQKTVGGDFFDSHCTWWGAATSRILLHWPSHESRAVRMWKKIDDTIL